MTSYNGQTITYDAIGNPLNYRDGISLTWQNGRELASFVNSDTSVSYTYDVSGMRTGKTVTVTADDGSTSSLEYTYVYENGLLLQMTRGSRVYDFSYDANGAPVSIAYRSRATANPTYYYYGLNSRGDVVALYSSTGAITALYEYDAYGNVTVKSTNGQVNTSETHIANVNPLRYRGYVYDNETGFYYLQTRYYDTTTCRFVNGDGQLNIDTFTGFNQFAYCNNNPILFVDDSGTRPVVGTSINNETNEERKASCKYMKDLSTYHNLQGQADSSNNVHDFIKNYESFESQVYDDGWGNPTIGYGHLITEGEYYSSVSVLEADILFMKDVLVAESYVDYYSDIYGVSLNQNQYDALVSVTFNLPASMIDILNDLNNGTDIFTAFTRDEDGGFLRRRTDEANIYLYGVYERTY